MTNCPIYPRAAALSAWMEPRPVRLLPSRVIDAPRNHAIRNLMRLHFFYGWIIVVVTFVTMAIGVNARTAFSLFFPPIIDEFG